MLNTCEAKIVAHSSELIFPFLRSDFPLRKGEMHYLVL